MEEMISMPEGTVRRLVNNERKFLWSPSANVTVVGRVRGDMPHESLRAALNRIPERHPLLASRVERGEDGALWFVHDPGIDIPLRVVKRASEEQWIDEIRHEMLTPWDQSRGPLIRFVLVHSPEVSEVVAFCQHAICDGTALALLLRDVLSLVADPDAQLQRLAPDFTLTEVWGGRNTKAGLGRRVKSFAVSRINSRWRKNPVFFDREDYLSIHGAYSERFRYGSVLMELDEPHTRALTERCREHGVTVNSALTTALYAALQESTGGGEQQRSAALPFDLRRRTSPPLGDVFCLLVGSIEVPFRYRSARSFWSNAQELHRTIVRKIERRELFESALMMELLDPTLADVIVSFSLLARDVPPGSPRYEKMSAFANDRRSVAIEMADRFLKSLPSIINTNLGRLDFPESYGGLELETMYFAPAGSVNVPLIVGALGVCGKLTATFNYLEPRGSPDNDRRDEMIGIRDLVLKYLGV